MSRDPTDPKDKSPGELGDTLIAPVHESGAQTAPRADPTTGILPGELFAGRYTILEQVGRGGMGEVFRARDEQVGDTVALKRLRFLSADTRIVERFRREVRLARRVSHRHVARIYDLGQHGDILFLSMEFIEGHNLEEVRRKIGRFPIDEVLRIGIACAAGLEAAHAADVIHQDLKPANIMQEEGGRIVITDFGIAAGVDEAKGDMQTAEILGTPAYMAPERVEGAPPDRRSDVYSLGVILYELLSAALPFEGKTPLAMATARLQGPALPMPERADLPARLREFVMACLDRDPDGRPATANEMHRALLELAPTTIATHPPTAGVSTGTLYAPMLRGEPSLRVRPFQYRGPADTNYLGDGIAEELVDCLSRTRGLRVIASVTPDESDSKAEASVLVDGTVHRQGNRFRIIARLTNADTKTQLWSEVFQGEFEDLFAAQEEIARRVAESLRLEVQTAAQHQRIPPEAVQLYYKARKQVKARQIQGPGGAIDLLDRCLELAPELTAAIGWRALAIARSFWDMNRAHEFTLEEIGTMVESALVCAPSQAESHLAAAVLASQLGDYRKAAVHLGDCLEVAPTCAEAHSYLAELQCATGRQEEGFERLRLASSLDPSLGDWNNYSVMRRRAYEGDWDEVERMLHLQANRPRIDGMLLPQYFRFGMWARREDWLAKVAELAQQRDNDMTMFFMQGVKYLQGEVEPSAFQLGITTAARESKSLRFGALILQVGVEAHSSVGEHELALEALEAAVRSSFNDIDWIDHCPVIDPLRADARFQRLAEIIRQRAASVWATI